MRDHNLDPGFAWPFDDPFGFVKRKKDDDIGRVLRKRMDLWNIKKNRCIEICLLCIFM